MCDRGTCRRGRRLLLGFVHVGRVDGEELRGERRICSSRPRRSATRGSARGSHLRRGCRAPPSPSRRRRPVGGRRRGPLRAGSSPNASCPTTTIGARSARPGSRGAGCTSALRPLPLRSGSAAASRAGSSRRGRSGCAAQRLQRTCIGSTNGSGPEVARARPPCVRLQQPRLAERVVAAVAAAAASPTITGHAGRTRREIENLVYTYAERIDAGDLDGRRRALFRHGRIEAAPGVMVEGDRDQVRRSTRARPGSTRTARRAAKHVTTNVIDRGLDGNAGAAARPASSYVVFQQTDEPRSSRSSPAGTATPSTASTASALRHTTDVRRPQGDLSHHLLFDSSRRDAVRGQGRTRLRGRERIGGRSRRPGWSRRAPTVVASDLTTGRRPSRRRRVRRAGRRTRAGPRWPTARERHGQLDVLVNVAGNRGRQPDRGRHARGSGAVIDVNLTGTFLLSQAALPALLEDHRHHREHGLGRRHPGHAVTTLRTALSEGRRDPADEVDGSSSWPRPGCASPRCARPRSTRRSCAVPAARGRRPATARCARCRRWAGSSTPPRWPPRSRTSRSATRRT